MIKLKNIIKRSRNVLPIIKSVTFFGSLAVIIAGGILALSPHSLYAQTGTTFWNVERDGANWLNFYLTTNGTSSTPNFQLGPDGATYFKRPLAIKQGINEWNANTDSGLTGARHYQFGYQEGGAWSGNPAVNPNIFPDLVLGYHTGVKMGGAYQYGGVKFFSDHPSISSTQLFSVGDGDQNVRVANWLHFPNVPDGSNTGISATTNSASFAPNNGTFGPWRIRGNRGSWNGIEFDAYTTPAANVSLMVGPVGQPAASVYTGMHLNGTGWLWHAIGSDMYAGTFRDISNGGYYLDPAGASNLNGATFASGPYTNDWFRANGSNGLYFQSYGGGWHMIDSTYIRSYGNKPILAPSFYDQDNAGYYVDPNATSNVNQVNATTFYNPTNATWIPYPGNGWNYIRGNSYIGGDTGVIKTDGSVGIGTTNPYGKLSVGFGNGDQTIFYQPYDDALAIQTTLNGQPNNGYGGHGANRLILQPTVGYVGIKATSPTADLHIKQSDQSQWGGGGIKLERSSSGYARIFMGDDQQLYFFTNSNSHYCIVTISSSISCASDERLKSNITPLSVSALDILSQLKPTTFEWKSGGKHSAGFIAQDVEKVLPDAVTRSENDGYYALSDSYFTPYLVKGVQELAENDKSQKAEIELLKQEIAELKKQMSELKK